MLDLNLDYIGNYLKTDSIIKQLYLFAKVQYEQYFGKF